MATDASNEDVLLPQDGLVTPDVNPDADASTGADHLPETQTDADILHDNDTSKSDGDAASDTSEAEDAVPPPPTIAAFDEAVDHSDSAALTAFLAAYDMPICESGTCLFVTIQPESSVVQLAGDFNDWANGLFFQVVPFAHTVYHVRVQYDFARLCEYKLLVDDAWQLDKSDRYISFGPFGLNSAVYAQNASRLTVLGPVHSPQLDNDRLIYVYLPARYFTVPDQRMPVLYMQDGFNVFANPAAPFGSWEVDRTADNLAVSGLAEPVIIVGIDTADRLNEYLYTALTLNLGVEDIEVTPLLDTYRRFLVDTLKPLVDTTFRTLPDREHTAIAGSSLGGISALYIAWKEIQTFSRLASLSGSFWVGEEGLSDWIGEAGGNNLDALSLREIILANAEDVQPSDLRVYLDSGDTEGGSQSYPSDSWVATDWTRNALITRGWGNRPEWDTDNDIDSPPANLPASTPIADVPNLAWSATVPEGYADWHAYLGLDSNLLSLVGHGHEHNEAAWSKRFAATLIFLFPGENP